MPYSNVISRTDAAALIPEEVSREIVQGVLEESVVLRLGRKLANMARAQTRMPVLSLFPTGYFVNGDTGLKKTTEIGHFVLPIAAIRGEGTSDDYFPPEVPAMPSFKLHKYVSQILLSKKLDYRTGVVYTTNRRIWEWDLEFKK